MIIRLCAKEPRLRLKVFLPRAGLELGAARSTGQHLTQRATGAPNPDDEPPHPNANFSPCNL